MEGSPAPGRVRILSYRPSPRLWKATVAARIAGVALDIRAGSPEELRGWIWDFDARPAPAEAPVGTTVVAARRGFSGHGIRKTHAFLRAHPFGTVPAAFGPDGRTGVFESNAILRLVARLATAGPALLGRSPYEASRIDSYLDAGAGFAHDVQRYLLALREGDPTPVHGFAADAAAFYFAGIERSLSGRSFLVGEAISAADIAFACDVALLATETRHAARLARLGLDPILPRDMRVRYPEAWAHFECLCAHPAFAPDLGPHRRQLGF